MSCAHPHTPSPLPCLPPLPACHRCSTCSPFGGGQDALSWETVAQRGALGLLHFSNAHNRTTSGVAREGGVVSVTSRYT